MKKIVCIAVIAMSGVALVSCDADGVESTASQFGKSSKQKEIRDSMRRIVDSIPGDTINLLVVPPPGPGDDPIIVPPPPKP